MTAVRAAVLRGVGKPFEEEEIHLAPVGPTDVRVKIAASGVCHSDLSVANGSLPFMFPTVLGHEGAGVVEEVGESVTRVSEGDHVVLTWMPPCRSCYWCLAGQPMLCEPGLAESLGRPYASLRGEGLVRGLGTATFATETLVPDRSVVRIDPSVPLELASLVGCALSTGTGAVWRTAQVPPGASVAVIGCGGVGLSVIAGARIAGAQRIVAVDNVLGKLERARVFGATDLVDASQADVATRVRDLTEGRGADFCFEVVGRSSTIKSAFAATRRGGTTVLVGAGSPSDELSFSAFELFVDAKSLIGCVYGSTDPDRDFPVLASMVASGAIPAAELVSRKIALSDVNEAMDAMAGGDVARSVVVFEGRA